MNKPKIVVTPPSGPAANLLTMVPQPKRKPKPKRKDAQQ